MPGRGVAAGIAAVCLIPRIAIALRSPHWLPIGLARPETPPAVEHHQSTGGEPSSVTLGDGTVVSLDLDTAIDVVFSDAERRLTITRGQAFFAVAKNPRRPFIVDAGDRRIAALGTQFDVRLEPDRVTVVLLEGKLSVRRRSTWLRNSIVTAPGPSHCRPGASERSA